ncbi:DUF6913 domain-containing protein [Flavobacterium piscis]|uniref:Uncharacterized protein n=1 Tax=Flavobacterium piscis TaxID=1114874 RepID=A0ABU1Y7E4_9FLAO|nr:hypothetical protein [Flavobacterium piscis]MDR7210158.1 hypothetical protein [Flavobacterium piscis]
MFLNYIKEFFVKKSLKNNLHNDKIEVFTKNVQTVGLLVDESKFRQSKELINELTLQGIAPEDIKIVVYRSKFNKQEVYLFPAFGNNHIDWKAKIKEPFLTEFIEAEFDLLISYYDIENSILMMLTSQSKAKFKVGFSAIDKKINRWMISTDLENYKLFISELFKYLKNIK